MNIKQQVFSLAISVTSLLYSNVFASAVVVKTEVPKLQTSTQIITQQSTLSIEGIWQAQDKYRIQIYQNNGIYNGKIIWIALGQETKDVKCTIC
ncbi:hypothetical protein [Halotia branconii]|uniref:Uncharacterized protein n=1 Tax=Halotia branconii CENA392 TaxID=1539056 RepID=A0AAJ6P924_9CYAN|nr:hypothetical protein [Halotia branconii]WGV25242.1 hypothetical protein QI031_26410 [Halotia branconii CENA392]